MKPISQFWTMAVLACVLSACGVFGGINGEKSTAAAPVSPAQQVINDKHEAASLLDQLVLTVDQAIKTNLIKGQDTANAVKTIKAAREGLRLADTLTDPTAVKSQVDLTLAGLKMLQSFLLQAAVQPALKPNAKGVA